MAIRHIIVEAARRWLGTPFLHQGRTQGLGVDCAGLLVGVAHELGLSQFENTSYSRSPDGVTMERTLNAELDRIPFVAVRPGDVLFFSFFRHAQHLAIVTQANPLYIIHAHQPNDRVVEHRLDNQWRARVRGSFCFHGVSD